jgi:hypothetical protein
VNANTASAYSVVTAAGNVVPTTASYDNNTKVTTLTFANDFAPGTYTINVNGLTTALGDAAGNLSTSFTIEDKTAISSISVTGTINTASHQVTLFVDFPENMMFTGTSSVLNTANWFVKDSVGTERQLNNMPTGYTVNITKVNDKRIKITIDHATNDFINAGADATDVKAQLIADANGNITPSPVTAATVPVVATTSKVEQNTAAVSPAVGVKFTGPRTIVLRVNNYYFDTVVPSDFIVNAVGAGQTVTLANTLAQRQAIAGYEAIAVVNATVATKAGYSEITLTTASDLPYATKDIYVATAVAPTTKTTTNLEFTADRVFANGGATNATKANNGIAATLVKATVIDSDNVILEFSNDLAYINKDDFRFTVSGIATPVVASNAYGLDGDVTPVTSTTNRLVKFKFAANTFASDSTVTVKTVTSPTSVDVNGTNFAAITTDTAVRNQKAVEGVAFAKKTGDTLAGALSAGDTITIDFTEQLPSDVSGWVNSIKLIDATNEIQLFSSNNATGNAVGSITFGSADVIPVAGDGKINVVTPSVSPTDSSKLVLTMKDDVSNTVDAYSMNYVASAVGVFKLTEGADADYQIWKNKDGNYFNVLGTTATTTQLVEAKTISLTKSSDTKFIVSSNYGLDVGDDAGAVDVKAADAVGTAVGVGNGKVKAYITGNAIPGLANFNMQGADADNSITITVVGTDAIEVPSQTNVIHIIDPTVTSIEGTINVTVVKAAAGTDVTETLQ